MELAACLSIPSGKEEVLATGKAGTVYVCHPLLVHAAQSHRGKNPRFMAQAALMANKEFEIKRPDGNYAPVESAIRKGLGSYNLL
ncbi:MAG: hypothetical protein WKI04_19300 [Ferruginibacter sp.]